MTLQLASDIALTAEIIDAATGLVACSAYDLLGDNVIDAEYTVIDYGAPTNAPLLLSAPATDVSPSKKVYTTPFIPRGQFFKRLREEGKLGNRSSQPRPAKTTEISAEAKPARQRSPGELAAIRRHYASARNAA